MATELQKQGWHIAVGAAASLEPDGTELVIKMAADDYSG